MNILQIIKIIKVCGLKYCLIRLWSKKPWKGANGSEYSEKQFLIVILQWKYNSNNIVLLP